MGFVATILSALGVIGLIWGLMQKFKAGRLAKAPFVKTGDAANRGAAVAGPRGAVSAEGNVACGAPLTAPASGTPCLYYELKVEGSWKDGDSTKSKDYVDEKQAAIFAVDDGSGPVDVLASGGGDFDMEETFSETKKEGFLADLKGAIGKGKPIMFGQYAFENPPMSKANKFKCTERVLKVHPRLYVLGKSEGRAIGSPSWTSLILSQKSRDQLMGATAKAAKGFLIGGAAVLGVGVILGVISLFVGSDSAADARAAEAAAATVTAKLLDEPATRPPSAPTDNAEASPGKAAPASASTICARAVRCCRAASGRRARASCDALLHAPEATCTRSLASFKRAVAATRPRRLAACR